MRIAICDDDRNEQEQVIQALRGWDPTRGAECFLNGASLLEAAKGQPPIDIVFLDIYLPGEDGIEIAGALKEASPETQIVFITTSREHAIAAFSVRALHYLVKPVTAQGVIESFRRLTEFRAERRKAISFTVGSARHTVFLDQVCLLENANHSVNISLTDGRRLRVWMSLNEAMKDLDETFLKINRGIVVNMSCIVQMGTSTCTLRDGTQLPIAVRQSTAIRAAYDNYVFSVLSRREGFEGDVS